METWKSIEPSVWKPHKAGDYIIGTMVNKEPKNETSGLSARYYLENEEGTHFLWGCAVLDDRMQYAKVGDKVRITFEGETNNKRHQRVKLYRVEVAAGRQPRTGNGVEGPKPSAPVHLEELEDEM